MMLLTLRLTLHQSTSISKKIQQYEWTGSKLKKRNSTVENESCVFQYLVYLWKI
jgi:hypothetical protein